MAWLKGFTFDGINSLDYGFYISSASVYDAPNRVVEMTDVPGKNGALAIDTGRFENIEVKYHVYSACDTQEEFSENIQAFRNAVCSRYDYARLTDDYNAGEYRLALYKDGLSVNAPIDRYGGFDVVFECKPQRFLTSGETERSIPEWSDLHTDSGNIVTVDNSGGEYAVKSLSIDIVPQQSGSGDPAPDNVRPITGFTGANIYVSPTTSVGDATTYNVSFGSAGTVYGGTLDVVTGALTVDRQSVTLDGTESWSKSSLTACDIFLHSNSSYIVDSDTMLSSFRFVNASTTQGVGDAWIGSSASQLRIGFSAYGTTDLATFKTWLSNNPVQLVRKLATPLTYQLTATQVAFLLGTNNIWSNTGDIQIEYGKGGNTLYNPTPFDSLPLIKVTGTGTLGIGSWIITITGTSGQIIYIDCDIMDAYKITGGIIESANNLVSFNKIDYPRLVSGLNNFSVGTGITEVKVIPRWWRV